MARATSSGSGKARPRGAKTTAAPSAKGRKGPAVTRRAAADAGTRVRSLADFTQAFRIVTGPSGFEALPLAEVTARKEAMRTELRRLYSDAVFRLMSRQPVSVQQQFLDERERLQLALDDLDQRELDDIANQMQANDERLQASTRNLSRETDKLESAAKLIAAIAAVVEVVARVVALAV